jgi:hypothetical protein
MVARYPPEQPNQVRARARSLEGPGQIYHPDYRELTRRVNSALAMMEASVEVRRRSERAE